MIITRNWLNKFINIKNISDQQITNAFNLLGFEVEEYKNNLNSNENVTVGKVIKCEKIVGTKLNKCLVKISSTENIQIICGGDNVEKNTYVLVAKIGANIANGLNIKERKILNNISYGMICSVTELGLIDVLNDYEKNNIYKVNYKKNIDKLIGDNQALNKIGFIDSVWDVDLTVNRSDCFSAWQLLKELSNFFNLTIKYYSNYIESKKSTTINIKIDKNLNFDILSWQTINIEQKKNLVVFSNQDLWLKHNLVKSNKNFYTNISNIIAIESGYYPILIDQDKIKNELNFTIKNNCFVLLDGKEIICELFNQINKNYLINENCKNVLKIIVKLNPIEFKKLNNKCLNQMIYQRSIKKLSHHLTEITNERLAYWFEKYNINAIFCKEKKYIFDKTKSKKISFSIDKLNSLIGHLFKENDLNKLFNYLDSKIIIENKKITFLPDKYRTNIIHEVNAIAEIARVYGYNNIFQSCPIQKSTIKEGDSLNETIQENVCNYLMANGFDNIKTYSLTSKENNQTWNLFNYSNPIELLSPQSEQRQQYRLSLIGQIINVLKTNYYKNNTNLRVFEFAKICNLQNIEHQHLSIGICGPIVEDKAYKLNINGSYAYLKGIVENIFLMYNISLTDIKFNNIIKNNLIHPYISAEIIVENQIVGYLFSLDHRYITKLKTNEIYLCELNISKIEQLINDQIKFKKISKYQKSTRDITIITKDLSYQQIVKECIENTQYLTSYKLEDLYKDVLDVTSVTIKLEFNNNNFQLKDSDVNESFNQILTKLKKINVEVK